MLGEDLTFGISGRFGAPKKKFNKNFSIEYAKLCLSLHYSVDNLFVNGKEMFVFKANNNISTFQLNFVKEAY